MKSTISFNFAWYYIAIMNVQIQTRNLTLTIGIHNTHKYNAELQRTDFGTKDTE